MDKKQIGRPKEEGQILTTWRLWPETRRDLALFTAGMGFRSDSYSLDLLGGMLRRMVLELGAIDPTSKALTTLSPCLADLVMSVFLPLLKQGFTPEEVKNIISSGELEHCINNIVADHLKEKNKNAG